MKTFSLEVNGDSYQVAVHPDIINFLIVHHQTGQYLMMKLQGGKWRCLNDNPYCSYMPFNDINSMVERLKAKA
jgi:hypothetical protein